MRLDLHIDGDEQVIINFNILITSLLELGERKGLVKYRLHARSDDDIIARDEIPDIPRDSAGRVKSITPEIETYICRLHIEHGWNAYDISRELRINDTTARKVLGKYGLNNKHQIPMSEDQIQEAIRLYTVEKLSGTAIAKKMERSQSTISKHLQAAGVMTRLTPAQVAHKNVERSNVRRLVLEMPKKREV